MTPPYAESGIIGKVHFDGIGVDHFARVGLHLELDSADPGRRAAIEEALRTAIQDGRLAPVPPCRRPGRWPPTSASPAAP